MKCLSIRQPWAWLITHPEILIACEYPPKDAENRTWPTRYRGPLLIHAGKALDREGWHWVRQTFPALRLPERFDMGGIVGECNLTDCVEEAPGNPWFFGPYGFVLRDARPLPFRESKGQLGFFEVTT